MEEEKFNQTNISNIIRNILTLRYDPTQKTSLPILNSQDFSPSNHLDLNFIENTLQNSIQTKLNSAENLTISLSGGIDSTLVLGLIRNKFPDLKINAKKSFFGKQELEYLGYWITQKGIQPIPKKINAIHNIAPPTTRKEARRFIGLINYYRDMWPQRAAILAPINALTSEKVPFKWTKECQESFEK